MEMAHFINWYDELISNPDKWTNHGRRIAENSCSHKTQDTGSNKANRETNMRYSGWCGECDFYEDSCEPMINYVYRLYGLPDDDKISKIIKETCLTVLENNETGECFLVLCGGGMDLSQSIAYAYLLAGQRIPEQLVFEVCTQPCLSLGEKQYIQVMGACKNELQEIYQRALGRIKQIDNILSKSGTDARPVKNMELKGGTKNK